MSGLDDYPEQSSIDVRWQDCDAYGHVNNVVYYSWMDTAVTRWLYDSGLLGVESPTIGLCVSSNCDFHAPVEFPGTVTTGVRVGRIGTSSVQYEIGIFAHGSTEPAATGRFVHVYVGRANRKPRPLSDAARAALNGLVTS
jgi:acyl-CoA thioester hydrolase